MSRSTCGVVALVDRLTIMLRDDFMHDPCRSNVEVQHEFCHSLRDLVNPPGVWISPVEPFDLFTFFNPVDLGFFGHWGSFDVWGTIEVQEIGSISIARQFVPKNLHPHIWFFDPPVTRGDAMREDWLIRRL